MNQEAGIDLICSVHSEKIVSVKLSSKGEPQMFCQKCLTPEQISIEQLSQQLTELRSKKIQRLIELENQGEKKLMSLKKVFLNIKEMLNKQILDIIQFIDNEMNETKISLKQQTELLKQPINELSITQVAKHLKELNEDVAIKDEQSELQFNQIKVQMIELYLQLVKSLNKQIVEEIEQGRKKECINQQPTEQYSLLKEFQIKFCKAIAIDKDDKVLALGEHNEISLFNMDANGQVSLQKTLSGHKDSIINLCFSRNGHWFVSSDTTEIRIWQNTQDSWKCKQIIDSQIESRSILITNDDNEFISYHRDQIRIWMNLKDLWQCQYILDEHTQFIKFICLSFNNQYLASSDDGSIILWQKGQQWKLKQQLKGDFYKICFDSDNELIVISQSIGKLNRYQINNQGALQIQQTFEFDKQYDDDYYKFPIIFNQSQNYLIFHHFAYTYIMKKQKNKDYLIHQKIYGNHSSGLMLKSGKYMVLTDYLTFIQIYSFNEKLQASEGNQLSQSLTEKCNLLKEYKVQKCLTLAMDKDEQFLVAGQNNEIMICDLKSNCSLSLKQTISEHQDSVQYLRFSNTASWFVSADSETMRIWQQTKEEKWKCQQIIETQFEVRQIQISNDDKQMISCHNGVEIRIWMKGDKWKCQQILKEHESQVKFISLSLNGQFLVSNSIMCINLWQKEPNQKWKLKNQIEGAYHEISFISDNEVISVCLGSGELRKLQINKEIKLEEKQTLKFDKYGNQNDKFPIIFNQQCNEIILRNFAFTYIFKKQANGDFQIYSKIYGNHNAGIMMKNGQCLILCEREKLIQIWKIQ